MGMIAKKVSRQNSLDSRSKFASAQHKTDSKLLSTRINTQESHEEKRQKAIKSILNKLSVGNLEKFSEQLLALEYPTKSSVNELVTKIFEKALVEPKLCEIYVKLVKLISDKNDEKNRSLIANSCTINNFAFYNIKDALLEKCKMQIEQREKYREEIEITLEHKQKYSKSSEEISYKECYEPLIHERQLTIHTRTLGNINLIGHLYRYHLVTPKIIFNCLNSLLENIKNPHPTDVEAACKLLKMTGRILIDTCAANNSNKNEFHDAFSLVSKKLNLIGDKLNKLLKNTLLDNRIRFMCQDLIEVEWNNWKISKN